MTKQIRLNAIDTVYIAKRLDEVIVGHDDDTFSYLNGYSDNKLAEEVNSPGVNGGHVGSLRRRLGMRVQTHKKTPDVTANDHTAERLAALEAANVRILEELDSLRRSWLRRTEAALSTTSPVA